MPCLFFEIALAILEPLELPLETVCLCFNFMYSPPQSAVEVSVADVDGIHGFTGFVLEDFPCDNGCC